LDPAQYNQEIAKIKDFDRDQYLDNYVDSKTSADYRQLCESSEKSILTGLSIASGGLVTAIPSTFYGFYQEQKEKRLIKDLNESQRCDKTLNSPTHRDVYKKILEMDVHQK